MTAGITLENALTHAQTIDRPSGYYWIVFPHTDGQRRWEPGSWDNTVKRWALIGSAQPWFELQLVAVGPAVGNLPPPLAIN